MTAEGAQAAEAPLLRMLCLLPGSSDGRALLNPWDFSAINPV